MENGVKWKVGNGRSIRLWEDNWIPTAEIWQPSSRRPENCSLSKVSDLIDHQRLCWRQQLVEQLFQPQEVKQILSIPLEHCGSRDQMYWGMDKRGLFIVKSAYKLAFSAQPVELEMIRERCGGECRSCQLNLR